MKQLSLLPPIDLINISGLSYFQNYITEAEEFELLNMIDNSTWLLDLKRRVQHYGYKYGYKYDYKSHEKSYLGKIPEWLNKLCFKLLNDRIFCVLPDQVIINEYLPGQGIAPHIDCTTCFGEVICSLSLGSDCIIDFSNIQKVSKLLESRSLLVISSDAKYLWTHSIAARKSDNYNNIKSTRQRRVSLTFREVQKQND